MNKKELFDALDGFSQNLLVTLAEVEAIKKNLKQVIEENTALRLENPMVNAVRTMKSVCFVTSCYLGSKHADPTKF